MPNLFGDMTEEELYQQSVDFGDAEWEQEVARTGGPFVENYVEADTNNTLLYTEDVNSPDKGLHIKRRGREEYAATLEETGELDPQLLSDIEKDYGYLLAATPDQEASTKLMAEKASQLEPSIFTFGADAANSYVQSHEIRHMALDALRNIPDIPKDVGQNDRAKALRYMKENIPSEGHPEELWNRQFDAYRRDSLEAHNEEVLNVFWKDAKPGTSVKGELDRILKVMSARTKKSAEKFALLEAASQEYEGHVAPKGTSWKELYLKLFEQRQRSLDAAIRNRYK